MKAADSPRILLCADQPAAVDDLRGTLENAGYEVGFQQVGVEPPADLRCQQVIILESGRGEPGMMQFCRRLRSQLSDQFVPILVVTADQSPPVRLASFESGADTYVLRPFAPGELLAQVKAFLRIKELHDRLSEKTAEVLHINKRLQQAYQQIDEELDLARRLQLSFLPRVLPDLPRVKFAVYYRLCSKVGGDFYDVVRLDEQHVGFYVADAVGHGVPASLLTIFVKKGVQAKEIFGKQYRLLPPSEVLQRLNKDLVEHAIAEHPFITMVYALLNTHDGTLQFSRAGHPHPLLLPRDGPPRLLQVHGSLLGVFDTSFEVCSHRLRTADRLLLYSDGVDAASFASQPAGAESLLACAAQHRELPLQEWVDRIARDLLGSAKQADDLTLLGLEITGLAPTSAPGGATRN